MAGGADDDPFAALMGGGARSSRITRAPEKEIEKNKKYEPPKLGQHKNELNAFWKDGGSGLPPEAEAAKTAATDSAQKRGWRAKVMQRRYVRPDDTHAQPYTHPSAAHPAYCMSL